MLFVIMPLLLMIGLVTLESRDGEATFSSMEYRKYIDRGKKQDDMNIKKLFNSSRKKKTYDGYTVENVMEYLVDINRKFKITLVMVTHDSYAASFCDKVILLKDGIQFLEIEKNNKSNSTFLKDIYELLKRIGGE
mgnify:CR=1 FL=1